MEEMVDAVMMGKNSNNNDIQVGAGNSFENPNSRPDVVSPKIHCNHLNEPMQEPNQSQNLKTKDDASLNQNLHTLSSAALNFNLNSMEADLDAFQCPICKTVTVLLILPCSHSICGVCLNTAAYLKCNWKISFQHEQITRHSIIVEETKRSLPNHPSHNNNNSEVSSNHHETHNQTMDNNNNHHHHHHPHDWGTERVDNGDGYDNINMDHSLSSLLPQATRTNTRRGMDVESANNNVLPSNTSQFIPVHPMDHSQFIPVHPMDHSRLVVTGMSFPNSNSNLQMQAIGNRNVSDLSYTRVGRRDNPYSRISADDVKTNNTCFECCLCKRPYVYNFSLHLATVMKHDPDSVQLPIFSLSMAQQYMKQLQRFQLHSEYANDVPYNPTTGKCKKCGQFITMSKMAPTEGIRPSSTVPLSPTEIAIHYASECPGLEFSCVFPDCQHFVLRTLPEPPVAYSLLKTNESHHQQQSNNINQRISNTNQRETKTNSQGQSERIHSSSSSLASSLHSSPSFAMTSTSRSVLATSGGGKIRRLARRNYNPYQYKAAISRYASKKTLEQQLLDQEATHNTSIYQGHTKGHRTVNTCQCIRDGTIQKSCSSDSCCYRTVDTRVLSRSWLRRFAVTYSIHMQKCQHLFPCTACDELYPMFEMWKHYYQHCFFLSFPFLDAEDARLRHEWIREVIQKRKARNLSTVSNQASTNIEPSTLNWHLPDRILFPWEIEEKKFENFKLWQQTNTES